MFHTFFFLCHSPRKLSKTKFETVQIIQFENVMRVSDYVIRTLPNRVDDKVTPKVWMICGVFNVLSVELCTVNVFFDCSYSLG